MTAPSEAPEPGELAAIFARCFRGADGARALAHLSAITITRRTDPRIDEASLRHLEGQRFLVAYLHGLVARGRRQGAALTGPRDLHVLPETEHEST